MKKRHSYVLGTGLSHDGSACLLKDGKICVAIEKERITRLKHDGSNDTLAIKYCLDAEGITVDDLDLVVQSGCWGNFHFGNDYFGGSRLFKPDSQVPMVKISHQLAHAYSIIGTCPYKTFNILVVDGCGDPYDTCVDLKGAIIPDENRILSTPHLYAEKESYYRYENGECKTIFKDFSEIGFLHRDLPVHSLTLHSIGGVYGGLSEYCFGGLSDTGKLMGLGPYGRPGIFTDRIFDLKDGRVFVNYDWIDKLRNRVRSYQDFKNNFQYYADIAYWLQREVERALLYTVSHKLELDNTGFLGYTGGVALNAVANAKIVASNQVENLYLQPAAGDNGLAIGCAFYGWLEVLKKEKVNHDQSTCFGISYPAAHIQEVLDNYTHVEDVLAVKTTIDRFFDSLNEYYNKSTVHNPKTIIQFNIQNYGVYQVAIDSNGNLWAVKDLVGKPTCTFTAEGLDFCKCLVSADAFLPLYTEGRITVTNNDELSALTRVIDLQKLSAALLEQQQNEQLGSKLKYTYCPDVLKKTAQLLAEGKIVGWFQDGCEFGPRALGRRSILADPRNADVGRFINAEIKFREDFRPFAPSVIREEVQTYWHRDQDSPYMILVDQVRSEWRDTLKSVVHQDGSSRVQTVTPDWNPKYYNLLKEFQSITGLPVLLNTSFNRRGMPIVETPKDAVDFFLSCKLDYLVMDNFIIEK